MTDSLIVARALLRLGPFAGAVPPERRCRSQKDTSEQWRDIAGRSCAHSQDPWHTGAARAAFTIWATEATHATNAPAGRGRR